MMSLVLVSGCEVRTGVNPDSLIPVPREVSVNSGRTIRICGIKEVTDTGLQLPEEGYSISIKGRKAVLTARDSKGLAHARATLAQLAGLRPEEVSDVRIGQPSPSGASCTIRDAISVKWRR